MAGSAGDVCLRGLIVNYAVLHRAPFSAARRRKTSDLQPRIPRNTTVWRGQG